MRFFAFVLTVVTGLAAPVAAETQKSGPLVELFTSQGCSSCPPADAMLAELSHRDDVVALALHVDYWDYIGWADDLADPAFTRRQQAYAEAKGSATVYTPQVVIGGQDHVIGSRPLQVMEQLMKHAASPARVEIALDRRGNTLSIAARARGTGATDAVVQVVRYLPRVERDIRRGENAGRRIVYVNAVTHWNVAGRWNTSAPLQLDVPLSGSAPVAVIVQQGTNGPVLGAAALE